MSDSEVLHLPAHAPELPSGWRWRRLDAVCLGIFDCPHSTPELAESGPLMVRTQDVRGGIFRSEQAAHVSERTYRERTARAEPVVGDLLYSREGTYFGDAAEVPSGTRVCLGQRMVLLRPDPAEVQSRFLRYWLNSPLLRGHIQGHRDGSVAERLNLPTIRGLPVAVAPLPVQVRIARALGSLDEKIEVNRRMSQTLEALAQALFKSWFIDFDPVRSKADGGHPEGLSVETAALFPAALGQDRLPLEWRCSTVGQEFDVTMGQSPPGDTYNEVGEGTPFFQGRTDFGFRFPANRVYCTAPTRVAGAGDTLVSVRAPVGDVNVALERCAVGRGVAAVQGRFPSFTLYSMQSLRSRFQSFESEGTVFGAINKSDFHALSVIRPPKPVVERFEAICAPLDARIRSNELESRTLALMRSALLPKLMSGEIRLAEAQASVAKAV